MSQPPVRRLRAFRRSDSHNLPPTPTHHGVPAQRGPVGESAAAEAAHVGLLPRVNPLVPLEGIELGELLVAVFAAVRTLACNGTSIMSVLKGGKKKSRKKSKRRLLFGTCVDFQMLVEGVPLSEAAAALLALVRPGAGVDVGVVSQVFLGREALPARLAHERFLASKGNTRAARQ